MTPQFLCICISLDNRRREVSYRALFSLFDGQAWRTGTKTMGAPSLPLSPTQKATPRGLRLRVAPPQTDPHICSLALTGALLS